MNRRSALLITVASVMLAGVGAGAQQSADDIIARNFAAKGGLEKIRAVQSLKQIGRLTIPGGIEASMTLYGKRPNMTRQEISVAGQLMVNAFDGQTAWRLSPMQGITTPLAVSGPEAEVVKEQSDFDGPLVDYKLKGYTIELVGTEPVGGKRAFHLKITSKDKKVQHCYVDVATSLEMKTVVESPMGPLEQELSDYRDVEGVKLPFLMRTLAGGVEQARIQIDTVELNAKFDDVIFRMPNREARDGQERR